MSFFLEIFTVVGCLHIAKANVNVTLASDFISSNDGYYLVDGKQMTLECSYASAKEVSWKLNQKTLLQYSPITNTTGVGSGFENKVVTHTFSSYKHSLVLNVNKSSDEGSIVICAVKISGFGPTETGEVELKDILVPPSGVTLSTGVIITETQTSIQCDVHSVYQGKDVTEFKLRLEDSYLTGGNKIETSGSVTGTYTVTYVQNVTFTYNSHQDQQLQCEVTWMKGTSVETKNTSNVQILDIYYKATSVTLQISDTPVEEGSSVTFNCSTSSNPSPRLRLYRQRNGQATGVVKTVTDVVLSWINNVMSEDNKAEFYCGADDNKDIEGWNFDLQSEWQTLTVWYKPTLTCDAHSKPNPTEGDTGQIECTSTPANPEPVLNMYKGEDCVLLKTVIGRTLNYMVAITREINGLKFECKATSSDTTKYDYSVMSDNKSYNVSFPPLTNTLSSETSFVVKAGYEMSLSCTTGSSNPVSKMVWEKGESEETIVGTSTNGDYGGKVLNSSYTFSPQKSDNGAEVSCTPKWKDKLLTKLKKNVTMDVLYPPSKPTLNLTKNEASENETITVKCSSENANPKPVLTLYQSNVMIGNRKTDNRVSHNLLVERTMNGGSLHCTATSSDREKFEYNLTSDTQTLSVKFPPLTNTLVPGDFSSVVAGTNISLTCKTGVSNPVSEMVWQKDGSGMTENGTSKDGQHGGKVIESTYTFTPQESDNGAVVSCTPKWEDRGLTELKRNVTLDVLYPPVILISGSESPVEEDTQLAIDCNVTVGNPESLTYFNWQFEPKYNGTQSKALLGQTKKRELTIENTLYSDAGKYRCTAGNKVGNDTDVIEIVVHYPPQLFESRDSLAFYSGLNDTVTMSLKIRAFPELQTDFFWTKVNETGVLLNNTVMSDQVEQEVYTSELTIDAVTRGDYGSYNVNVSNGVNGTRNFTLELLQRGPPETPRDVTMAARAATKATVSWRVGLNGGSVQTFRVEYWQNDTLVKTNESVSEIDPPEDKLLKLNMSDLKPETDYKVVVISMNLFNNGSETRSGVEDFKTRAEPVINSQHLLFDIIGAGANVTWNYDTKDQNYTTVMIEQCVSKPECVHHNVTGNNSLVVPLADGELFYLVIYHDGLESYRSEPFSRVPQPTDPPDKKPNEGSPTAAIVGAVVAVMAVAIIVVIVGLLYLRHRRNNHLSKEDLDNCFNEEKGERVIAGGCTEMSSIILSEKKTGKDFAEPDMQNEMTEEHLYANTGATDSPPPRSETLIQESDLLKRFCMMANNDLFTEEFGKLPTDPQHPWTYGAVEELKDKNRFRNMLPYDNNRVQLQKIDGDELSDYINASFLKGCNGKNTYIATIGCTKDSVNDVWRMVWEQEISVIVMVTNLVEKKKRKCEKYWPTDNAQHYGEINVTPGKITTFVDYEIKHFTIEKGEESRSLVHYHYIGWPDHGVPLTAGPILKIREHIKQHRNAGQEPIMVHCSAGVGRTGTFIAVDYLLEQIETEGEVDVLECVKAFRDQRVSMIQTKYQYRFVYEVLTEAVCVGKNTTITCADCPKTLATLKSNGGLDNQFQLLQATKPSFTEKEVAVAKMFGNKKKNKDPFIIAAENHRVILKSSPKEYINAVYVSWYKTQKGFIATQTPVSTTVSAFWTMIMDEKCQTIVCLENDKNDLQWYPKEEGSESYETFVVTNTGSVTVDGIRISGLTVQMQGDGTYANVGSQGKLLDEELSLMVFDISDWSKEPIKDKDISLLRKVYSEVQQWQQKCDSKTVTATCLNGANETGLYIATTYLFEMANAEQEVDIFHALKEIRRPRPQFITSLDQYTFLHDILEEYISQFGTYANFS